MYCLLFVHVLISVADNTVKIYDAVSGDIQNTVSCQFHVDASRGYFPSEVAWTLCDFAGGAPFTGQFIITISRAS